MGTYDFKLFVVATISFVLKKYVQCSVGHFGICEQKVTSFRVLHNVAISKCMTECARRGNCHRLNYIRRTKECIFYNGQTGTGNGATQSCLVISRDELDIQSLCNKEGVCQSDGSSNSEGECPVPKLSIEDRGVIYGNILSTKSKIKVECKSAFFLYPDNKYVTCAASGSWEGLPKCVAATCGEPCPRFPYTEEVRPGGIHDGDTRTYACQPGFFTNTNIAEQSFDITCQVNGAWTLPPAMCVTDTVFPRHPDAIHYKGCFVYEIYQPWLVTHAAAHEMCKPYGQLAKLNTSETQTRLKYYLSRNRNYAGNTYWIQGVYDHTTDKVTFSDGTETINTFWGSGQPPVIYPNRKCLNLPKFTGFKWAVQDCNMLFGYICEYTN